MRSRWSTYGPCRCGVVDVLSNTLQGDFTVAGSALDFAASHSVARQERPYDNEFTFNEVAAFNPDLVLDKGPEVIPPAAKNRLDETFLQFGDYYSVDNLERDLSASFNVRTPFVLGLKISGHTKFGAKYRTKRRSNDEAHWYLPYYFGQGANYIRAEFPDTEFGSTSQGLLALTSFLNPDHDVLNFLDDQYELTAALDRDLMREIYEGVSDEYFNAPFADMADFEMKETITAGYAMMELNLGSRLMILPGIRYEHTDTHYDAKTGLSDNARSGQGVFSDTTATRYFST